MGRLGRKKKRARGAPLFPSSPARFLFLSIIDILMGIPSGSLCGGERHLPTDWNRRSIETCFMRWVTRKSLPETSEVERQPKKHQHIDQGRQKIDDPIHNPNFQTDRIRKPGQNFQLTRDPRYFSNPRIRSIYRRNPQSVSFLRPNPLIRGPIHPPPFEIDLSSG